jgi:hypothetical protein
VGLRTTARRHPSWVTLAALLLVLAVFGVVPTLWSSPSGTSGVVPDPSGHVVLVGVPGTRWSDVSKSATPRLFAAAGDGGIASLSVRTVAASTCLTDAWLTISAGRRATGDCARVTVTAADDGSATVDDWSMLRDRQRREDYDARPGLLGDAAAAAGARVCAVGPEAAVGAADSDGHVPRYWPSMPSRIDPECAITLVAGTELETEAAALSDSLTGGSTVTDVYLAGIADAVGPDAKPGLRVLVHQRYGRGVPTVPSRLSSPSTRWPGLAQLTDLTPTILAAARVTPPADVVGTRIADDGRRGAGAAATVRDIRALVTTDDRAATGVVAGWTALAIAGLTAIIVIAAVRIRNARGGSRAVGRGAIAGGLAFVAWVPLTTYLSRLIPLATWSSAGVQITVSTLALAAIGAAVLILWLGRHPRHAGLLGVLVISAVTAGILGLDTMTGGSLQRATPFGNDPVLGGRFYGIRNLTFGLFAAGVLLAAAGAAFFVHRRAEAAAETGAETGHGRALAVRAVAVIGLTGILIDGLPATGADVGGMLSLTPGVLLLAMLAGGVRLSWLRLLVVAGAGIVVFLVVGGLDYSQPVNDRTHIGQFVARVFDGEAWTIVTRKIGDALHAAGPPAVALLLLVVLVVVGIAVCAPARFAASRWVRWWSAAARSMNRLAVAYDVWPSLRLGVWSLVLTGVLGMLANDSGLVLGLAIVLPLVPALAIAGVLAPRRRRR